MLSLMPQHSTRFFYGDATAYLIEKNKGVS
jgi:hypothetical protein